MYSDDFLQVALAGGGRDGFLISYDKELGEVAEAADPKKDDDKDGPMTMGSSRTTRYAPTAKAAAVVIAAILDKAAKDATKGEPHDAFDKAFARAAKEV
jgi:hypothetical protein